MGKAQRVCGANRDRFGTQERIQGSQGVFCGRGETCIQSVKPALHARFGEEHRQRAVRGKMTLATNEEGEGPTSCQKVCLIEKRQVIADSQSIWMPKGEGMQALGMKTEHSVHPPTLLLNYDLPNRER